MMKSILLGTLALGLALALPAAAQEGIMPKGAVVAVKVGSLEKYDGLLQRIASLTGEEMDDAQLPITRFHSMAGVDRKKPFYIFLSPPAMSPLFAMPLSSGDAFAQGAKFPGFQPQVKGDYGLLGMGGPMPEMGGKGLAGMPAGDVVIRLFGSRAMQTFGGQLTQYKMLVGMMTMGMGPEKSGAVSKLYDKVMVLAGQVEKLDLHLVDGARMEIGLSLHPLAGSDLAGLHKVLGAGAIPPGLDTKAMLWFCNQAKVQGELPGLIKEIADLYAKAGLGSPRNEKTRAWGDMAWTSLNLTPGVGLTGSVAYTVNDRKVLEKAMSSKEGMVDLLSAFIPDLTGGMPGGGIPGGMPQPKEMVKEWLGKMEYEPGALEVGGTSLHRMSITLDSMLEMVEEKPDKEDMEMMRRIMGGNRMSLWLGFRGGNLVGAVGPPAEAEKVFGGLPASSLPAFARGALVSGRWSLGPMLQAVKEMGALQEPVTGEEGKEKKVVFPECPMRFTFTKGSDSLAGRLTLDPAELARIIELMK